MSNNKNTEITANKGFAVMTNRNVLNEAMAGGYGNGKGHHGSYRL